VAERTCPGTCCAAFTLPRKPDHLFRDFLEIADGTTIAAMAIPLTPEEAGARILAAGGVVDHGGFVEPEKGHWYTCRFWDELTGLCRNYESRPEVCREYPYGDPCNHDCGYCGGQRRAGQDDG
jgi:Fe-S-cluster containining protein